MTPRKQKRISHASQRAKKQSPKSNQASAGLKSGAAALPEQRPRIGLEATTERVVEHQHTIQSCNPRVAAVF
jgi:hypothetical protein